MLRSRKRIALFLFAVAVAAALAAGLPAWLRIRDQARILTERHLAFETAHPGWSFPARVWSAPAPLDLPPERLVLEAKARGYTPACPPAEPGQVCEKTGAVIPRGGRFPEGVQPPGTEGWTRPLALEPVLIGTLVGPDAEIREHLPLAEAPRHLLEAIVQAEDRDFQKHHGVNLVAGARAAWANLTGGAWEQGASTLTMQLVRSFTGEREKLLSRKAREAATALAVDGLLGKDAVLQAYLDAPYLGQSGGLSVCGFQAAARWYWGKDAKDLTLGEAATLAAILPAPGRYAPDRNPDAARQRRDALLDRMEATGWDVAAARAEPVAAAPHPLITVRYPAYLQAVRTWLEDTLPPEILYGAGLEVWTALDLVAQEAGETVLPERTTWIRQTLGIGGRAPILSAGAVIEVATGFLVAVHDSALDGSTDFSRVTQARRQPGSAFKPVVYALAFSRPGQDGRPALTAAHTVPNSPRTFEGTGGWRPRNATGEYTSTSCLAMGLAWSQNIATASLLEELGGPEALIPFATRLGFDTGAWPAEMGLALGQAEVTVLELARFNATVAAGGHLASGRPVVMITDPRGTVRVPPPAPGEAVLTPEAAALTRELMRLVVEYGTGGRARGTAGISGVSGPIMGKTGTTDGDRDLWFVGATPTYAGALWVGRDIPERIGVPASDFPAPLWGWWMRAVHKGLPTAEFQGPTIERKGVCSVTGRYGNGTCRLIPAPFLAGTRPEGACPVQHVHAEPDPKEEATEYKSRWVELQERQAAEAEVPPPAGP